MAHAPYIREKARSLRVQRQLSIDQLSQRLGLSRTTIYYWVRDLPIPGSGPGGGWPVGAHRKGNEAMQRKYRLMREAAYIQGREEFDSLANDLTFRDFVCLYLAEGFKRTRNTVVICNSDPSVMMLSVRWLRALTEKPVWFSIQYHADQDLEELRAFWGDTLDIPPDSIKLQRKSNSGQLKGRSWRSVHGVLAAGVNDTLLRARMQAWMDRMRNDWL
jgi:AcrR family transcriptional regulator